MAAERLEVRETEESSEEDNALEELSSRIQKAGGKVILACEMRCEGAIDEETKDERVIQAVEAIAEAVKDYRSKEERAREESWKEKNKVLQEENAKLKKEKKELIRLQCMERDDTLEILRNCKLWENKCKQMERKASKGGKTTKPKLTLLPAPSYRPEMSGSDRGGKGKNGKETGKRNNNLKGKGKKSNKDERETVITLSDSDDDEKNTHIAISEGDLSLMGKVGSGLGKTERKAKTQSKKQKGKKGKGKGGILCLFG